ncbi:predicted protein [Chaetomium globosum CBS 148.51]|uniref:Uncharacterized protein n=1 Tax=Chaetomium globosum (strain ATCC 6205 / CBS 148.51 / DSM 1962 / NBRC 6347 / NRRL 1970) TaxID=306901 RepID=Q2H8Y7_CHAGB|nr:uncharacterized protein CHGG_03317 [Chaetomium globosum CBS 148.51]EAQ91382.1 predicted protein [Chaetomium globosum CBS 148.51]
MYLGAKSQDGVRHPTRELPRESSFWKSLTTGTCELLNGG